MKKYKGTLIVVSICVLLAVLSLVQFRNNRNLKKDLGAAYAQEASGLQSTFTLMSRTDWTDIDTNSEEGEIILSHFWDQLDPNLLYTPGSPDHWHLFSQEVREVRLMLSKLQETEELTDEEYEDLTARSHALSRLLDNIRYTPSFDWYKAIREQNPDIEELIKETLE